MIERYSNFYEQRSASRERSHQKQSENKENSQLMNRVDESLGLRDPVQELEKDLAEADDDYNDLSNPRFIK